MRESIRESVQEWKKVPIKTQEEFMAFKRNEPATEQAECFEYEVLKPEFKADAG